MLRQRLIFGTVLALAAITVLVLDGYLSTLDARIGGAAAKFLGVPLRSWLSNGALSTALALLFTLATTRELVRIGEAKGCRPFAGVAYLFAGGHVAGPYLAWHLAGPLGRFEGAWPMMWMALAVMVTFIIQAARRRTEQALANIATTLFIVFYAGGLAGFLTKLRMEVGGADGVTLLLLSIFTLKMNDTGAFFTGLTLGRNKMIEWLSPKKTWEGFAGGLAAAVVFAVGVGSILHWTGVVRMGLGVFSYPWGLIVFGLTMGIASVVGDLCASLLKRDAAIKDSGRAIPGMGGVLDVFDSVLIGAPAAWFYWCRLAAPLAG